MVGLALLTVWTVAIGYSNGVTIGPFKIVAPGVYDAWKTANPQNVNNLGSFGMVNGHGKLWLVSRRMFRRSFDDPWDPASRGGIVSTLRISNGSWVHTPYDRLDDDQYGELLFSLNGRMFMLTYSTNQQKIGYHKLFFWDDDQGKWIKIPFEIDPTSTTISTNAIQMLAVNVPDTNGTVAYTVASAHAHAQRGSEMAFSKLDTQFRGNVPIKATLTSIGHQFIDDPSAVVFTAVKNNTLYALVQTYLSEGYVPQYDLAYTIDLNSRQIGNVTLNGSWPTMDYEELRMFQFGDRILIAGGHRMIGLGQTEEVNDIWSLDLNTLQWASANATIPDGVGPTVGLDQDGKLFVAGLKEGIHGAEVKP